MARQTQLVEVDLESGITTNAPLLKIGPRLWKTQNSAWGFRYPRKVSSAQGPWMMRTAQGFPSRTAIIYTGAQSFRDIAFTANGAISTAGVLLIGANGSDQLSAWPETGGAEVGFAGGVTRSTISAASKFHGCSAKWENPGTDPNGGGALTEGVVVFSHLLATHVYYLLDSGASIRSLTTDVTNCPAGAAALAVHLDRLWLLKDGFLYYTDPLNLDTIRTTNVIRTLGQGRCLVPGQLGDIDTSGVPHLMIASANSIQILDGDPQLGGGLQADLRVLSTTTGFASPHAACVTPFGIFGLSTDYDLKWIPPGCQELRSVGEPIRDRLGINNVTKTVDADGTSTGSIVWYDPYLYIFPGGETSHFYIAEPSEKGLSFWGPITGHSDYQVSGREAVVRAPLYGFSTHAPSGAHVPSLHSVDITPSAGAARYLALDSRATATGSYPNGTGGNRGGTVQTGLLNVPGHRVTIERVILEVLRVPEVQAGIDQGWTVGITDELGVNISGTRTPEAVPVDGTFDPAVTETMHFTFPGATAARRAWSVAVVCTAGGTLALQRMLVEIRTSPAQF